MPTGKWHNKMESLFDENMREVKFYCSTTDTNVCRRADILLNNRRTCEVQHSYIAEKEIIKRFNDWDNSITKEIRIELLNAIEEYYKSYHIDIYNYLINLQETNVKLWEESPSKIIDKIIKESNNYPTYIIDFFKDINTKIEEDDDYSYINNFETFNTKLNKKLNINLKKYFDI